MHNLQFSFSVSYSSLRANATALKRGCITSNYISVTRANDCALERNVQNIQQVGIVWDLY
jgi:hypothetical protein